MSGYVRSFAVIADSVNRRVRRMALNDGGKYMVDTLAGSGENQVRRHPFGGVSGPGEKCAIGMVLELCMDRFTAVPDTVVYATTYDAIRRIDIPTRHLTTVSMPVAATDGSPASPFHPFGLCQVTARTLLFSDRNNECLWSLYLPTSEVQRVGGVLTIHHSPYRTALDGDVVHTAQFKGISSVAVSARDECAYVCDYEGSKIVTVDLPPDVFR